MVTKYELDLLDNAIDSLNEALVKYQEAIGGNKMAFKFCVLHLSHFLELIFKHYVSLAHPLLIYKKPFENKINEESQTIGLEEAINFLINEGKNLPKNFITDLKWFKKLRNRIEHHKFTMEVEEVKNTIGRLMKAFVEFDQLHACLNFYAKVSLAQYPLFLELSSNYELARGEALARCLSNRDDINFQLLICPACGNETMVTDRTSSSGIKCFFCQSEEPPMDMEVPCDLCDQLWPLDEMNSCDWYGNGQNSNICPRCRRDPEYVKED